MRFQLRRPTPNAQRLTPLAVAISIVLSSLSGWCDEPKEKHPANRLAQETSPYLLLHAHNPVDWYPWGAEALAKAKAEKKLIFLSIGYSSCYWCHVMERESFMDDEIAGFMNKNFVCIKVDREERPDVDEIYMASLHALGRPGGWPLTMFLTPDAKPFFGGTYFPARDKDLPPAFEGGPPQRATGFLTLLALVADRWQKAPDELSKVGDQLAEHLRRELAKEELVPQAVDDDLEAAAVAALAEQFDAQHGGFGFSEANSRRPKFPEPSNLLLLIDHVRRTNDDDARKMLVTTLEKMAAGGIRDHVSGGFHRYSTDRFWQIPHFEKMLYDNGQLASVYAEAWQLTSRDDFRQVAEEMLAFVAREMTDASGGFYAAIDAETDGDEGAFYVWTREEVRQALPAKSYPPFAAVYGLDAEANFEDRYVLRLAQSVAAVAKREGVPIAALNDHLQSSREKLLEVRNGRKRPLTDTKIIAGWNGLMIRGFADAGRLFGNESYLAAARRAAEAVLEHLRTPEGRLLHCYTAGQAKLNAYLDDYAFFIDGLLALHRATSERRWLDVAAELAAVQQRLFWDDRSGGYFFTSDDHETLLARPKDPIDSATPSGNSVAAGNLAYLAAALDNGDYLKRGEKTVAAFARFLNRSPAAMPRMVVSWSEIERQKRP